MVNTNEIMKNIVKVIDSLENRLKVIEDNSKLLDDPSSDDQYVIYSIIDRGGGADISKIQWALETKSNFQKLKIKYSVKLLTWNYKDKQKKIQLSIDEQLPSKKIKNSHLFYTDTKTGKLSVDSEKILLNSKTVDTENIQPDPSHKYKDKNWHLKLSTSDEIIYYLIFDPPFSKESNIYLGVQQNQNQKYDLISIKYNTN